MSFNIEQLLNFAADLINPLIDERKKYKILKYILVGEVSIEQLQKSRLGKSVKRCTKIDGDVGSVAKKVIKVWAAMIDRQCSKRDAVHEGNDQSKEIKYAQKSKISEEAINCGEYDEIQNVDNVDPFDSMFQCTPFIKSEKKSGKRKSIMDDCSNEQKKQKNVDTDYLMSDALIINKDRSKIMVNVTKNKSVLDITPKASKIKKIVKRSRETNEETSTDDNNDMSAFESIFNNASTIKSEKLNSEINNRYEECKVDRSNVAESVTKNRKVVTSSSGQSVSNIKSEKVAKTLKEIKVVSPEESDDDISAFESIFNNASTIKAEKCKSEINNRHEKSTVDRSKGAESVPKNRRVVTSSSGQSVSNIKSEKIAKTVKEIKVVSPEESHNDISAFESIFINASKIKEEKLNSTMYNNHIDCKLEESSDMGFIPNDLPELPTLNRDQYNVKNRSDVMETMRKGQVQGGRNNTDVYDDIDVTSKYSSERKFWTPQSKNVSKDDVEDIPENHDKINGVLVSDLENYNAKQLLAFEGDNRKIIRQTKHLWEKLFNRNHKSASRFDDEKWRDAYLRVENEAEEKLKKISERLNKKTEISKKNESKAKLLIHEPFKPTRRSYGGGFRR